MPTQMGCRMNKLSYESQMLREAIVVALRSAKKPMAPSELQPFMPWQLHRDDTDCRQYPHCAHATNSIRRVTECHLTWHMYESLPSTGQIYQHLISLERRHTVRRIPGRSNRVLWELTPEGAAADEINALQQIINLDTAETITLPQPRTKPDINWRAVVNDIARFDATEYAANRSHLLTADTYRHATASALAAAGTRTDQLELTAVDILDSQAMTLHANRRTAIVIADLRSLSAREQAAAQIMDTLYQTAHLSGHERVLVLIAGMAALSQVEVLIPAAIGPAGTATILPFQHAISAGLKPGEMPAHTLPDLALTALGCSRRGAPHQAVIAMKIATHDPDAAPATEPPIQTIAEPKIR